MRSARVAILQITVSHQYIQKVPLAAQLVYQDAMFAQVIKFKAVASAHLSTTTWQVCA